MRVGVTALVLITATATVAVLWWLLVAGELAVEAEAVRDEAQQLQGNAEELRAQLAAGEAGDAPDVVHDAEVAYDLLPSHDTLGSATDLLVTQVIEDAGATPGSVSADGRVTDDDLHYRPLEVAADGTLDAHRQWIRDLHRGNPLVTFHDLDVEVGDEVTVSAELRVWAREHPDPPPIPDS